MVTVRTGHGQTRTPPFLDKIYQLFLAVGGGTAKELGWTRLRNLGLPWAKIKSATGMSDVKLASTLKDAKAKGRLQHKIEEEEDENEDEDDDSDSGSGSEGEEDEDDDSDSGSGSGSEGEEDDDSDSGSGSGSEGEEEEDEDDGDDAANLKKGLFFLTLTTQRVLRARELRDAARDKGAEELTEAIYALQLVLKSDQRLRSELITLLAPSGHKAATVRKGLLDKQYFVVGTGSDPVVKLVLKGVKTVGRREKNRKWLQALMTAEEEEEAQLMHEDLEKEYRAKYGRKPELPPLPPSAPLQPQGNSKDRKTYDSTRDANADVRARNLNVAAKALTAQCNVIMDALDGVEAPAEVGTKRARWEEEEEEEEEVEVVDARAERRAKRDAKA